MTSVQVAETSVTNNSSSQNFSQRTITLYEQRSVFSLKDCFQIPFRHLAIQYAKSTLLVSPLMKFYIDRENWETKFQVFQMRGPYTDNEFKVSSRP